MSATKEFIKFINSIHKDKLSGWRDHEYPILMDRKVGYRVDHQGLNNDSSTKPHRIFIQPLPGGTSKASKKLSTKAVVASIHCDDPEDDQLIRDGLIASFKEKGATIVV